MAAVACGHPLASWQHLRADALGEPLGDQAIVGLSDKICIGFLTSRCAILVTIIWCGSQPRARCGVAQSATHQSAETETVAAQVFITRSFEVLRPTSCRR